MFTLYYTIFWFVGESLLLLC